MFKSSKAMTFDLSNWNPFYLVVSVFVLCLIAGKNYYCDKFYLVSQLPKDRNETSLVKSIRIKQENNKFIFNIKINFIFSITKTKFREYFGIKFESPTFTYVAREKSSFFSSIFTKNEWNFEVLLPFTSDSIHISYLYRDRVFHEERQKFNVKSLAIVISGTSYAVNAAESLYFSNVCLHNQNFILFQPNLLEFNYYYRIQQTYMNETYENFKQLTNSINSPDNSVIYFNSYNNCSPYQSLFEAFLPMMSLYQQEMQKTQDYVTYKPPHIFYVSNTYSPLVTLAQLIPSIHVIYDQNISTCFPMVLVPLHSTQSLTNQNNENTNTQYADSNNYNYNSNPMNDFIIQYNKNNLKSFRSLIQTKKEGNKIVIIDCPIINHILNIYPFINEKYKHSKIVILKQNMEPKTITETLYSAKAVFIGTDIDMLYLIAVPHNCAVHRIIEKGNNYDSSMEKQFLSLLDLRISYETVEQTSSGYNIVS